ncbi:MAG: pyridoxal phosphate-dependent aminotransferase [Candidatus Geothermarchaeales archaeon]
MGKVHSERVRRIIRMTMADMADLADKRPGAIRLENADTDITPHEHIVKATRDAVGVDRYNSYLPLHGLRELREAIARRYRSDLGLSYDPEEEIVVTSGAGEAMLDALLTFVDPGDKVLLTDPTYSGMAQRVRLADGLQSFTELSEEDGWHLNLENLRRAAKGCKVIFYMSPAMPTGVVFTRDETKAVFELAEENDSIILFNASLDKIVYDGRSVVNPATLKGAKDRTVIVGSVSKNYGMMGWRIGWATGPKELIKPLTNVHIFNGIMPSGHSQAGATAALSGSQDWVRESVRIYQRRRDVMYEGVAQIPGISAVKPEGGWYFIANIRKLGIKSTRFCLRLLEEKDVATTPMVAWGSDSFGWYHVRFIFTNESEERLGEAAERIEEFVKNLQQ